MKGSLQFDFIVNKDKNTVTVRREFAASRERMWDVYTKSELLDQWFAPKPLTTKTKTMDFREGGYWLYAMIEPDGKKHWGRLDYLSIHPITSYSALDGFCDENGVVNADLPRSRWDVTFEDLRERSVVQTIVSYQSLADLETVLQMGVEEGMRLTMESLEDLLSTLIK